MLERYAAAPIAMNRARTHARLHTPLPSATRAPAPHLHPPTHPSPSPTIVPVILPPSTPRPHGRGDAYMRMAQAKWAAAAWLLRGSHDVLLSDPDVVLLRDPVAYVVRAVCATV